MLAWARQEASGRWVPLCRLYVPYPRLLIPPSGRAVTYMAQMHPGFASVLKGAHVEREGDTAFFLDDEGRPVVWMDWGVYEKLVAEADAPAAPLPKSQFLLFLERFGL
jgi:hypothetical protein